MADPAFAQRQVPVHSVDVLPIDIDLGVSATTRTPPMQIADRFNAIALSTLHRELVARGYSVTPVEWSGEFYDARGSRALALGESDVAATADSLRGYGHAQRRSGESALLTPYLPARLGDATGSDTTLYVGGWAYVGKTKSSTGRNVAIGVFIGVVVVVVIIAAVAGSKGNGNGGGLGKAAGGVARAGGRAAATVVRGAIRATGHVARSAGRVATSAGKGTGRAASHAARTAGRVTRAAGRAGIRVVDAMGRSNTHIDVYGGDVRAYQRDLPRAGYSRMYVELTLIDNQSGRTLWHARQRFYASAAKDADTQEVMRRMMTSLPDAPR